MIVLSRDEIRDLVDWEQAATAIEDAYRAASRGQVQLPPVGHIVFPDFDADCHIKYGHRLGDASFVIKIATGFPNNDPAIAPSGNGLSLVLSAETGQVQAVLHDAMLLTDIRTGIGGALASRTLAHPNARRLLIVGSGIQARQQAIAHTRLLDRQLEISMWARSTDRAAAAAADIGGAVVVEDLATGCANADIIVTTTAATTPLIESDWLQAGTHITAVGADAPGKRELHRDVLVRAQTLVADSADQCLDHGELAAIADEPKARQRVVELGAVLAGDAIGRVDEGDITVADLTGIAAQDIAIASVVLSAHSHRLS